MDIYKAVEKFPKFEENNITSQLRRAATCLPLNIAEGSGARSPRIFLNYLIFAYRSVRETETLLMLSRDLNYLPQTRYEELNGKLELFAKKLYRFMDYLENDVIKTKRKRDLTFFFRQQKDALIGKREEMDRLA